MNEKEDITIEAECGEYVSVKLDVTFSKNSPKVIVIVKAVAALDRIKELPEMVNTCFDDLLTEATEKGLPYIPR